MRSAVRLFCFLIGMGFQQIQPLLLLVNLLLVLLLVMCPESAKIWLVMCPESAKIGRFYVSRKREDLAVLCVLKARGKLHGITAVCGNGPHGASGGCA